MNKNFGLKHSFVEDEVEEGEEVEEDVPSLLSLEQTNGQDHLLLGEVGKKQVCFGPNLFNSQDAKVTEETLVGGLNDLQGLSLNNRGGGGVGGGVPAGVGDLGDLGGGGTGSGPSTGNLLDF